MSALTPIEAASDVETEVRVWMSRVLEHFACAEQAIGRLCVALQLPITNGSLTSLGRLRERLAGAPEKRFRTLENRIARWDSHRPLRHLLAHASLTFAFSASGEPMLITRHLPRDASDVTPDKVWTDAERAELLRQAANDSRSICDQIRNLLGDPAALLQLRQT